MHTRFFIVITMLIASAPAVAAETWDCTVTDTGAASPHVTVYPHNVQIQIDGDDLGWTGRGPLGSEPTRHYHIAVNDDVGVVAVFAQATTSVPSVKVTGVPPRLAAALQTQMTSAIPAPLINSYTIALNKQDGSLRTGLVGTTDVREDQTGKCQLETAPGPANPQNPK